MAPPAEPRPRAGRGRPPLPESLAVAAEKIGPPLSRAPWSPEFAVQAVELLPVFLSDGVPTWLKPVHAASLQVALPKARTPAQLVLEVIAWYPLSARMVHSTSWRLDEGRVVLTYLVAIESPAALPEESLTPLPVERHRLARGRALSAPANIGVAAVLEHALRHLKWLLIDDPAVAAALPDWRPVLDSYRAEPFRSL